jgi:hypothetical protein
MSLVARRGEMVLRLGFDEMVLRLAFMIQHTKLDRRVRSSMQQTLSEGEIPSTNGARMSSDGVSYRRQGPA